MSADFQTTLIKDSRLADITDELSYAVLSGPSSNTYQQFSAVSTSNSAISFNAQIPSENIVVSREVLLNTDIHFTINITNVPPGSTAFNYGVTDAFQAFPLNSLFTTCSSQINNTNVSCNLQDVLPSILRLNNNRELYRYNGMCPVLPDQSYKRFADGINTTNNPLGDYQDQSYDGDLLPRGAYPIQNLTLVHNITAGGQDASPVSTNVADTFVITGFVNVTEPLLGLSPFIYGEPEYNKQGLVGINAMSFVFNIDSSCKRFWSTANGWTYNVSLGTQAQQNPFTNCRMLMNFLSTQPTDLISAKNVVPYMDLPRYLSLQSATGPLASGATAILNSQNIQINQLPDYFIISVRKPMSQQTVQDSSSFLRINSISVNLNNTSGLLSSATPQDLWRISVNNHSQQSWAEFSGQVSVAVNATGVGDLIPTTGSLLILNPAYDLSLPDYLSCGSIGQYNFQFQVSVTNIDPNQLTPEICIICVNSGVFTTLSGSSNIFTGILTKQMVLDAKTSEEAVDPVTSVQYKRYVGGALLNRVASAVKHMPKKMRRKIGMGVGAQSVGMGVIMGAGVGTSAMGGRRGKSRLDELCR
jgi:hypothetical protein